MILRFWILIVVFFVLVADVAALELDGRCNIRFLGTSTLHDFEGRVDCRPFTLQSIASTGDRQVIRQLLVSVPVKEMDTENASRDEKLRAMFESELFPEIKGQFADLDPELVLKRLKGGEQRQGTMEFDLQIRELSQRITAAISELSVTPERISFLMEFPVSLASFALKPPSVLGFIRVDDQVRVEIRVFLQKVVEASD